MNDSRTMKPEVHHDGVFPHYLPDHQGEILTERTECQHRMYTEGYNYKKWNISRDQSWEQTLNWKQLVV